MVHATVVAATAAAPPTNEGRGVVGDTLPAILMVSGIVLIGAMLMISVRRRVERRANATVTPRERLDEIKATAAARDESHALRAELVETGTRLCAQIDARAERLEQLIRHADERLDLLERRGGATVRPSARDVNEGVTPPRADDAPPVVPSSARPSPATPSRATPSPASPPPADVASMSASADVRDPVAAEINRLAADGIAPLEIAQRLDEPIGKVELILALARSGTARDH